MLGPGVITVNPYASIWVIVIVLLVAGSGGFAIWIGAGIGLAHGAGRAIGIMHQSANCSDPFPVMASQIRWKQLDGIALLIAFGTLSSSLLAEAM